MMKPQQNWRLRVEGKNIPLLSATSYGTNETNATAHHCFEGSLVRSVW